MSARDVMPSSLADQIDVAAQSVEASVIAWRRDLHANPELLRHRQCRFRKEVTLTAIPVLPNVVVGMSPAFTFCGAA